MKNYIYNIIINIMKMKKHTSTNDKLNQIMEQMEMIGISRNKTPLPAEYDIMFNDDDNYDTDDEIEINSKKNGDDQYRDICKLLRITRDTIKYLKNTTKLNENSREKIRRFIRKFYRKILTYSKYIIFIPSHPIYRSFSKKQSLDFTIICEVHNKLKNILSLKYNKTQFLKSELNEIYVIIQKYLTAIKEFIDEIDEIDEIDIIDEIDEIDIIDV